MQAKYLTSTNSACTTFSLAQNSCKLRTPCIMNMITTVKLIKSVQPDQLDIHDEFDKDRKLVKIQNLDVF